MNINNNDKIANCVHIIVDKKENIFKIVCPICETQIPLQFVCWEDYFNNNSFFYSSDDLCSHLSRGQEPYFHHFFCAPVHDVSWNKPEKQEEQIKEIMQSYPCVKQISIGRYSVGLLKITAIGISDDVECQNPNFKNYSTHRYSEDNYSSFLMIDINIFRDKIQEDVESYSDFEGVCRSCGMTHFGGFWSD